MSFLKPIICHDTKPTIIQTIITPATPTSSLVKVFSREISSGDPNKFSENFNATIVPNVPRKISSVPVCIYVGPN